MKTYKLTYLDKDDNELDTKMITADNIKEACDYRDEVFAQCMINDCVKIKVTLAK
ncbi:hypothetical protein [Bacteroides sp.]|uniref:hypothetical protein n=1 Tax=Bacteroides sp. TaxID=29523 RepID=UPI0026347DF3|nr:hypothetical protein [Bacteroides sp.]MDD3040894.1 hypothetical protein [Bacteroides sp.]